MSQFDKLISKIMAMDADMRLEELEKVLAYYGYEKHLPSGGSSHYTFRKPGKMPITIPKHKPIKLIYVKKVKKIVEGEMADEDA
ncbi:MAG: type II toxin-antitoxin system HicA family toxin [Hungatella hathewayi]|nr:type II toxin-antitoxin system HicA family toxin [Hungatella hathewayi]